MAQKLFSRRDALRLGTGSAVVLAAPAVHASCHSGGLRIRRRTDFHSFDPMDTRGEDEVITRNILAPLVRAKQTTQGNVEWEIVPHLATGWEVSDDGRKYSFALRSQTWSSGSNISADDVVASFRRVAGMGAEKKPRNSVFWAQLKDVTNTGDSIEIVLESPVADFAKKVLPWGAACVVEGSRSSSAGTTSFGIDQGPTSGRFKICELVPGSHLSLERDENWSGESAQLERASFIVIHNDRVADARFAAGEIDVMRATPEVLYNRSPLLTDLLFSDRVRVVDTPASFVRYVAINPKTIDTPELRRAIQLGIDPQEIVQSIYSDAPLSEGLVSVAYGFVPQHLLGSISEPTLSPDSGAARALVEEVGATGREIRIASRVFQSELEIARRVAEQLQQIDLNPRLVQLESAQFFQELQFADNFDLAIRPVFYQELDPTDATYQFQSSNFSFGFENERYDELHERLPFIFDAEERRSVLQEMQGIVIEDGAILPIEDVQARWLTSPRIDANFLPDASIGDLGDWSVDN
ncbi:ABC transporter substrate-binding protein [Aliiroseovarius sp. YM-037]|uniref:ABC transporter substrate-binding protein n=1 Tax=Aliiroseovarius sp. YM-037 TaxID=3341728 RepID=UPI003A7FC6B3